MLKHLAAASLLLGAANAHSAVIFSDNFDGEAGGGTVLNYSGFANWTVSGQVDLVAMPNPFGITCAKSCVDLDGSSGPGGLTSRAISFAAGSMVSIAFDLSGSQRSTAVDPFRFTLAMSGPTPVTDFSTAGAFLILDGAAGIPNFTGYTYGPAPLPGMTPFQSYFVNFLPAVAGSFSLGFSTTSADAIGPLLDNVVVTQDATSVPEPGTWSLLAIGLGLLAAVSRRRWSRPAAQIDA